MRTIHHPHLTHLTIDTSCPLNSPDRSPVPAGSSPSSKTPPFTPQSLSACIDLTLCHHRNGEVVSLDPDHQEMEACKQLFEGFNAHRRQHPPQHSPCNPDNRRPPSLRNPYSTTMARSYRPHIRTREEWVRCVNAYIGKVFLEAFDMPADLSTQVVESFGYTDRDTDI